MKETSPYEGTLDLLNGKTCLGQVVAVDGTARTCRVRTLGAQAFGTDDQDLPNVKVQHFAWHPEGDYAVAIPRIGAYVLVSFINSEPFVVGTYPLSNTTGDGGRDNQDTLLPGDFAFQTVAGNKIIIRSAGTVEIESTKGCRTYWLPTFETITTVCQNFELDPTGGYAHWTVDPNTGATILDFKAYDNAEVVNAVTLQVGTTADAESIIDLEIGPVDENLAIPTPNLSLKMKPDGTTTLNIGSGKITLTMTPDGKIALQTASDLTATVGGKVSIDATGDADITAGGDVNVNASGAANITAGGNAVVQAAKIELNGSSGMVLTTVTDPVVDMIVGKPTMGVATVTAG